LCAKRRDLLSAQGREPVAAAAAAVGWGLPFRFDPGFAFESMKHGIERGHVEAQHAASLLLDSLGDYVSVQGMFREDRQDRQFRAPPLDLCAYRWHLDSTSLYIKYLYMRNLVPIKMTKVI